MPTKENEDAMDTEDLVSSLHRLNCEVSFLTFISVACHDGIKLISFNCTLSLLQAKAKNQAAFQSFCG